MTDYLAEARRRVALHREEVLRDEMFQKIDAAARSNSEADIVAAAATMEAFDTAKTEAGKLLKATAVVTAQEEALAEEAKKRAEEEAAAAVVDLAPPSEPK